MFDSPQQSRQTLTTQCNAGTNVSLTSFLKNNADVRERFSQEFRKPKFLVKKELVAPPLTTHYGTVGTAFDYLLRFVIHRLNPNTTIAKETWVADQAVNHLALESGECSFDLDAKQRRYVEHPTQEVSPKVSLWEKGKKIVSNARKHLAEYLKTGRMSDALIESVLLLATLDPIVRAGVGHEMIGNVNKADIRDLKALLSVVDERTFAATKLCLINPTFGTASALVGGADADLVIDDTIIDIKTTKKL